MESRLSPRAQFHNYRNGVAVRADSAPIIDFATLGVRKWRGKSGTIWVEVRRTEIYVVLVPRFNYEDESSRKGAMTVPLKLLEKFFEEV